MRIFGIRTASQHWKPDEGMPSRICCLANENEKRFGMVENIRHEYRVSRSVKFFVITWFAWSVEMSIHSFCWSVNASNPAIWLTEGRRKLLAECAREIIGGENPAHVLEKHGIHGKARLENNKGRPTVKIDIVWAFHAWRTYESDGFDVSSPKGN